MIPNLVLDVAIHLHGLTYFIVTGKQQRQNFFQNLLKTKKTENAHFIDKIICLLKLLNFLFTHLKLILMNFILYYFYKDFTAFEL